MTTLTNLQQKVLRLLAALGDDQITIMDNDTCLHRAGSSETARIVISDRRAYAAFAGGSVAAAEAYINGWWNTSDLYALMQLAAKNIQAVNEKMDSSWRQLPHILLGMLAAARRRLFGRASAKADIAAHYDLGNEFFSLWLDDTLAYSCAVFPDAATAGADTLAQASRHKLDKICDKLELTQNDNLLDLGCGWGSMAFHAAAQRGCPVSAVTLSPAQHRFVATQPMAQGGQVSTILSDYRDFHPRKKFSKLSSVEMIEAVGEKHFGVYFQRIRDLLTDNGLAQVQAILIPDDRYRAARRQKDFIREYIFPGGMLPCMSIIRAAADNAGLRLVAREDIGAHYAPTLLAWRDRFNAQRQHIRALNFNDKFCRVWEYYFCYCAGAFASGALDVAQLTFTPARARAL